MFIKGLSFILFETMKPVYLYETSLLWRDLRVNYKFLFNTLILKAKDYRSSLVDTESKF